MGCTDRESNFQRNVYDGTKWWCQSGWSPSYEAEKLGPVLDKLGNFVSEWNIVHDKKINRWVATPKEPT